MNNIKKLIFKTNNNQEPAPPINTALYYYGTYACTGGVVGINSPTLGGSVYYVGDLSVPFPYDVTAVYSDITLTTPIPHNYIRIDGTPRYFLTVNYPIDGNVTLIQPEGDPC